MAFLLLIYAYLIGGVTFLPLLLAIFIYVHPKKTEQQPPDVLKAGEIEEAAQTGLDAFKQGWIIVTHEYLELTENISSSAPSVAESSEGKSAYASLYKLVKNSNSKNGKHSSTSVSSDSTDTMESPMAGGTGAGTKPANKKHRYYAVLKHSNLFLYKDERLRDVKHVVVLSNHIVTLWPRTLTEGSLFTKYSSIAILKKDWSRARRLSDNVGDAGDIDWTEESKITIEDVIDPKSDLPAPPGTFFIYTDVNIDKEDWYFALIRATKSDHDKSPKIDPQVLAKTLHFDTHDMVSLIQTLYSSEGQLQTKWFNALLGRIFLSLQKTDLMRNYLVSRIEKKLNKIKTPGFLDKFQITKVRAGHGAPFITFPVLKEINPEGDLLISLYMQYTGCMSIQLATKLNLNLGTRFKTREMDVLLSMTLEKIQGPMLLRVKPPPSARMWYTFEHEPIMSVKIEPIISSRQMSYNIITNSIEKKLKEAVKESLVLPHWDDFIFYHTDDEFYRGGVWDKDARREEAERAEPQPESEVAENASLAGENASFAASNDETLTMYTVEDDDAAKSESVSLTDSVPTKLQKAKLSATLGDLSKRLRKAKSTHTLGVDETNCMSDGSMMDRSSSKYSFVDEYDASTTSSEVKSTTLRKLGNWYYNDKNQHADVSSPATPAYTAPEMISSRRRSRKQSSATLSSDPQKQSDGNSYDFGASNVEPSLIARSIDTNADLLKTDPALPLIEPFHSSPTAERVSVRSEPISPPQNLQRSETMLHRKPPPPGPVPDFPEEL